MNFERSTKVARLTGKDADLFGRIAYAMVVVGLWKKVVRRTDDSFDFFEVTGQKGQLSYRIGRMSDGEYVLLDMLSGSRKRGTGLKEVLRNVAYVPQG